MKRLNICLIGPWRDYSKEAEAQAIELGRWVAENNHILNTGACLGIPIVGAKACKQYGGQTLGYSPANSEEHHIPENGLSTEGMDKIMYMNSDKPLNYPERNIINIRNADIVVMIAGRMGTINEYTTAHDMEKPIGVIEGVGEASNIARAIEMELYAKTKSEFDTNIPDLMNKLLKVYYEKNN